MSWNSTVVASSGHQGFGTAFIGRSGHPVFVAGCFSRGGHSQDEGIAFTPLKGFSQFRNIDTNARFRVVCWTMTVIMWRSPFGE